MANSSSKRDPALGGEVGEVLGQQRTREAVDAGRHGRVRREHAAAAHGLDGGVERQAGGDELADPLQPEEPGVALVGVEHVGLEAEGPQGADAADAEHDLLAQSVVLVAAVEAVGDGDAVGRVAVDVGVEQVQRDAADVGPPDVDRDVVAGEVDGDLDARVDEPERVGREVGDALLLPALGVEALAEVALGVEQADADERHAEVRRRLEVVAGEHAEAAGVLREGLADAELGGEVGDRAQRRAVPRAEPRRALERRLQAAGHGADVVDDARVGGQLGQPLGGRGADHLGRVGGAGPPAGPQAGEQAGGLGVPAPVQVGGQLGQSGEGRGDGGGDLEASDRAHGAGW